MVKLNGKEYCSSCMKILPPNLTGMATQKCGCGHLNITDIKKWGEQ